MNIKLKLSRTSVFALLFALCPFLMNYKIPFTQVTFTVGIFMLVFLVEILRAISKPSRFNIKGFYAKTIFFITFIFVLFNHFNVYYNSHPVGYEMSAIVDMALLFIELLGIILFFSDSASIHLFRKYTVNIALVMSVIVIGECIVWYVFRVYPSGGNHQLILPFLEVDSYDNLSAIISLTGLFRPSAFFLEPAHFSNYCIIALACLLFPECDKPINIKTMILTIAMLLTLSGFGIMLVALVWAIYLIIGNGRHTEKNAGRNIIILIVAVLGILCIYTLSPSFRAAIARFTGSEGDNGVYGRLGNYYLFVEKLQGFSRVWGMGYKNLPLRGTTQVTHYFTGVLDLLYCQGLIGTIVFCTFYVLMMLKIYKEKNMLAFSIATISFIFFIGSSYFSASSLLIYIPFLFVITRDKGESS